MLYKLHVCELLYRIYSYVLLLIISLLIMYCIVILYICIVILYIVYPLLIITDI